MKIKKINIMYGNPSLLSFPRPPEADRPLAENRESRPLHVFLKKIWIPAYAGMTEKNKNRRKNRDCGLPCTRGAIMLAVTGFFAIPFVSFAVTIIPVPFTSQAPFGNWVQPWQDFCEEASVVMAAHFLWGSPLTPQLADAEMQIIKQYEILVFKEHKDTSADQTAAILTNLFGFKNIRTRLITSPSDIKEELSRGNVIIAPAAGRLLKNPYFTASGPFYHMIVITGFHDERGVFITHDPGTRRGKDFIYKQSLLFNAIHDWNNGDVLNGEKKIIVAGHDRN